VQWSTGIDVVSSPLTVNTIPVGLGDVRAPQGNYPSLNLQAPVNPQNLNRYTYVLNNPLCYIDPSGRNTIAVGVWVLAGFGLAVEAGAMIVIDDNGNWGYIVYEGGGIFGGGSIAGGVTFQWTNADTILDLEGVQIQTGGSVNMPIAGGTVGVEHVMGIVDNAYQGVNVNVGVAASVLPAEVHSVVTYTDVDHQGSSWIAELAFMFLTSQWSDVIEAAINSEGTSATVPSESTIPNAKQTYFIPYELDYFYYV
jgi:hypothetical protein